MVCLYFGYVVADMVHDLKEKLGLLFQREESSEPSKLYRFIEEGLKK